MQKTTAILIDGAWFSIAVKEVIGHIPNAAEVHKYAMSLRGKDEELFRIFYYDSLPYEKKAENPISRVVTNYAHSRAYDLRHRFFSELGQMDFIALRRGRIAPRGWQLTDEYLEKLKLGPPPPPTGDDLKLSLEQKGVDMRIGIDVATLSIDYIVKRIILVSGEYRHDSGHEVGTSRRSTGRVGDCWQL